MRSLKEQASAFASMQSYLVGSASELFLAYRMPVEHTFGGTVETAGQQVMAVIGFAADGLRGAVLLLTSRAVVDALQPEEVRGIGLPADALLRDVLGEFANMLLGRIKNHLSARSLAPFLATPTTILGANLELPAPTSGLSAWHRFSGAVGDIFIRLDATFEAEFALAPETELQAPRLREGDMVLFSEGDR